MRTKWYKLIGYFNRHSTKEFSFVIPVFNRMKSNFRCEIDEKSITIKNFSPFYHDFTPVEFDDEKHTVGEEAIYMFQYKGRLTVGDKITVSRKLFQLMKSEDISYLNMYDIYYFLGIPEKISDAVKKIIKQYKSLHLKVKNFASPIIIEMDNISEFSNCIYRYSEILEYSRNTLNYLDYFASLAESDEDVRFTRYYIKKDKIKDRFDTLIKNKDSDYYKDLVVHSYIKNDMADEVSDNPLFRLRRVIDFKPITSDDFNNAVKVSLFKNSQSNFPTTKNALLISMAVEKSLAKKFDAGISSKNNKKELNEIEKLKNEVKMKEL